MSSEGAPEQVPTPSEGRLPAELLERILEEAWNTLAPELPDSRRINPFDASASRYRWGFYAALTATSHQFRALALQLPYRFVLLRTAGDLQLYKVLVTRQCATAQRAGADVNAAHCALFARAHVRLAYVLALGGLGELEGPEAVLPRTLGSPLIAAATSVALDRWLATPALLNWLFGLGALTHLRIGSTVTVPAGPRGLFTTSAFRGGRTREVPVTINQRQTPLSVGVVEVHGPSETWAPILTYGSLRPGLRLERLVLLTPQPLASFVPPSTLATVVLDAPPGADGESALALWGIPAALATGMFEVQRQRGMSMRLVIRGAEYVEPLAWEAALHACKAHGVRLELEKVY
jgi:hypothetical protein